MGRNLSGLLDHARTVQREQEEERRAARRSAHVPFVPKPSPRGWVDLELEIQELFEPLTTHQDEVEDILAERMAVVRVKARERARTSRELRKLAGRCELCPERVAPTSKRLCSEHLEKVREYLRRRARDGMCVSCSDPLAPTSKWHCTRHLLAHTEQRAAACAKAYEAGLCIRLCGRKIREVDRTAGVKAPALCRVCLDAQKSRIAKYRQKKLQEALDSGLCRDLCGREARKRGKMRGRRVPRLCEVCAEARRQKHLRLKGARAAKREAAKQVGLCANRCGREARRRGDRILTLCEACAEVAKRQHECWRRARKERRAQLAPPCRNRCGREARRQGDEFMRLCAVCADAGSQRQAEHRKAFHAAQEAARRAGLCRTLCGREVRRKGDKFMTRCQVCAEADRQRVQRSREERRAAATGSGATTPCWDSAARGEPLAIA
jgi:hypothetical protein